MKWFDRWFFRKWHWAWENKERDEFRLQQAKPARSCSILAPDEAWEDGLRIGIKKMIGGYVVSFRIYDRVRDRSDDRHYIITDRRISIPNWARS